MNHPNLLQSRRVCGALVLFGLFLALEFYPECDLRAQIVFVPTDFFPAAHEFPELVSFKVERRIESRQDIAKVDTLFAEAGAEAYAVRTYAVAPAGELTVEILTMEDDRGSYSLLTLLRDRAIAPGPPGDYSASGEGAVMFAQDRYWVRLQSSHAGDLPMRIARSIGNRIGIHSESPPSLVKHLPERGYEPASLRYCLGPEAVQKYAEPVSVRLGAFPDTTEVAQARYASDGQAGTLTLVQFPTIQIAEDCFDTQLLPLAQDTDQQDIYARRAGPIVGILKGRFSPTYADKLLGSLEYSYTVQWIYDKNTSRSGNLWDMPFGILGTVVRSLVLVSLLCLLSIAAGIALALFRIALRAYAPNNILDRLERTELIRLKLNED